jgi:hypothetical protein
MDFMFKKLQDRKININKHKQAAAKNFELRATLTE